jgi:hypothetical protein
MNGADCFGTGKTEQVVAAFKRRWVSGKNPAPEIFLCKTERLDHGTHCAVQNKNTLSGNGVKLFPDRHCLNIDQKRTMDNYGAKEERRLTPKRGRGLDRENTLCYVQ